MGTAKAFRVGVASSSAVALGLAVSAFVACTSDDGQKDGPVGDPADCRLIANRCHPYAPESDVAHECHEVGHEGASPKRCSELRPSCERACPPRDPDSGTGGSSGAGGASSTGSTGGPATGGTGGAGNAGGGCGGMAPDGGETACDTLGRVCHDVGAGRPEACHEIGHDGDERVCEEELAECLAVCQGGGM